MARRLNARRQLYTPAERLMARSAPERLAFRWARDIYSSMLSRRFETAAALERITARG